MAEPDAIFARVEELLAGGGGGGLHGKRVLVSAGGTREPIDSVRFLGNRSSGRMGVALAEEARRRGAVVTLLAANLAVAVPQGVELIETPTAADVEREALSRRDVDVVLMAAAVADYRPAEAVERQAPEGRRLLGGRARADGRRAARPRRDEDGQSGAGGVRAEHGDDGLARKRGMLADKNADLVVYNDVGREGIGFEALENEVTLIARDGEQHVRRAPKTEIAAAILDEVERLLAKG